MVEESVRTGWLARVTVRKMRRSDLPDLEWDGEYSHFRRVYADAFRRYEHGLSVMWVAELPEEGIIGQVFIQLVSDRQELADGKQRAYLYSFRVKPAFRGAGVGTKILDIVEDDLRRRGYDSVTLNVAKDNVRAQKLYERSGYQIVAHEPGIWSYPDPDGNWHMVNEPAWRMEKRLR